MEVSLKDTGERAEAREDFQTMMQGLSCRGGKIEWEEFHTTMWIQESFSQAYVES